MPNKYLEELRLVGDDKIDVLTAFAKTFENEYTGLFPNQDKTTMVNSVVKKEITKNLGDYSAFSFSLASNNLCEILDADIWPPFSAHV